MKGVYVLILHLTRGLSLNIGDKLFSLKPGEYVYVGSAFGLGGVAGRLNRHIRTFTGHTTKKHWHIDYLLSLSTSLTTVYANSSERLECTLVRLLQGTGSVVIKGFGNTDCKSGCDGHLVFMFDMEPDKVISRTIAAFHRLGLEENVEAVPRD